MKTKADFNYQIIEENSIIFIEDQNKGSMSLTNDMENVLEEIFNTELSKDVKFSLDDYTIIYRDSTGIIDGVNVTNNKFFGFFPIQVGTLEEAIEKLKPSLPASMKVVKEEHKYVKVKNAEILTYQLGDEHELIHIVKTAFKDKYFVLTEDAFEQTMSVVVFNEQQILETYKIIIA